LDRAEIAAALFEKEGFSGGLYDPDLVLNLVVLSLVAGKSDLFAVGADTGPAGAGVRRRGEDLRGIRITPALFSRPLPSPSPGEEGEKQDAPAGPPGSAGVLCRPAGSGCRSER
jgi:hypothetical protein